MTPDVHQFTGIDAAKWESIKALVQTKLGLNITSDIGDQSKDGIELSWSYNATTLDLTITLINREWFDPSQQTIDTDIESWVTTA